MFSEKVKQTIDVFTIETNNKGYISVAKEKLLCYIVYS